MNRTEKAFLEHLASKVDYWADATLKDVANGGQALTTGDPDAYERVKQALASKADQAAFKAVLADALRGLVHSVLVTIDGGSDFEGTIEMAVKVGSTRVQLAGEALHEKFYEHLYDTKRLKPPS